jgi:hypothetical protein
VSRVQLPSGPLCITANGPVAQWVEQRTFFGLLPCYFIKILKMGYKKNQDKTGNTKVNGYGLLVK